MPFGERFNEKSFLRTVEAIHTKEDLKRKLALRTPLRIKYGVDVTSPFLHIGHAVNLWKMRELQEMGHRVIFLIGDFTTTVGDPTGRDSTRPRLNAREIEVNAKEYINQVSRVLLTKKSVFEVRRNSEWYRKMTLEKFLSLLAAVTHSKLINRDMFQERIKRGREIYMHELIYPVLQGYDSFAVRSDITVVGSDQLFNELMGRFFQERFGQDPQVVVTTAITPGIDGKEKQSKSLGNYIALIDSPRDKFGKIMRIPDNLVKDYLMIYTTYSPDSIKNKSIMEAKMFVAEKIVERYHGSVTAANERKQFTLMFRDRQPPKDISSLFVKKGELMILFLVSRKLARSRSDARRLILEGAIDFNNQTVKTLSFTFAKNGILRIGKHKFFKVVIK